MSTSLSDGGSQNTKREPPTLGKQLVNFITCGCKSSAPFFSSPVQSSSTGSELMSSPVRWCSRRPLLTFAFRSNVDKLLVPGWWNFTWVIFKKMKTLCEIEGEISNWTNWHNFGHKIMSIWYIFQIQLLSAIYKDKKKIQLLLATKC